MGLAPRGSTRANPESWDDVLQDDGSTPESGSQAQEPGARIESPHNLMRVLLSRSVG